MENKNLATETKERLEAARAEKRKGIEESARKAAEEFAMDMTTFSVVLTEEEAHKRWGDYYHLVLNNLRSEGFEVEKRSEEVKKGFLGLKKTTVYSFKISVLKKVKAQ